MAASTRRRPRRGCVMLLMLRLAAVIGRPPASTHALFRRTVQLKFHVWLLPKKALELGFASCPWLEARTLRLGAVRRSPPYSQETPAMDCRDGSQGGAILLA